MTDFRAKLKPKPDGVQYVLGENVISNILQPLIRTGGLIFPYTPVVSAGNTARYDSTDMVHTIYGYNAYVKSYPENIGITATFTANTDKEARYLLSTLHFFKSVSKSYFGVKAADKAGTPPPVLLFDYLGAYMFNNVPVIVKECRYTLDNNINYVPVNISDIETEGNTIKSTQNITYVPTEIVLNITLDTQYTPKSLRDEFDLDKFRQGGQLDKGFI